MQHEHTYRWKKKFGVVITKSRNFFYRYSIIFWHQFESAREYLRVKCTTLDSSPTHTRFTPIPIVRIPFVYFPIFQACNKTFGICKKDFLTFICKKKTQFAIRSKAEWEGSEKTVRKKEQGKKTLTTV